MTRIVAGEFRGRRLDVPKGRDVRPTTDRMRERVFSMLMHDRYPVLQDARVADIFAGTGALGLEALSRGASHVTFVEQARPSLDTIRGNIASLGVTERTHVLPVNAKRLPAAPVGFDFVFMDPPYRQGLIEPTLNALLDSGWLADHAVIVAELATDDESDFPVDFELLDERSQGQQRVVFLGFQKK